MVDEKEISDMAFEAIELAKKSGRIRKGTNEVTKAVESGAAKLVVIAKDVNPPEIVMHLPPLCKEKGIPFIKTGNKEEIGAAAGLHLPTSAVAIVQEGDAKEIIKKITNALKG